MDAFFEGLDCRLQASGRVGDSVMMGIVNSAMEDAYKKSLSKEGDLERLNEKSRFCELAIVQLEWCLKYLQEETENNIVESADDREQLLKDLLETRDRIHRRLEETELAIAEKDLELMGRKEKELKLRLALEVKGEEVSLLHSALGLERVMNERVSGPVTGNRRRVEDNGDHAFDDLGHGVDDQISRIRASLDDGRRILANLMKRIKGSSFDIENMDSDQFGADGDSKKTLLDLYDVAQLKMEIDEIGINIGMLKEKIDTSFQVMGSSVSLLKIALDDQQLVSSYEREIMNAILSNYTRDIQCKLCDKPRIPTECFSSSVADVNWSDFMDDITSLHDELESLVSQMEVQPKTDGGVEPRVCRYPLSRRSSTGSDDAERYMPLRGKHDYRGASRKGEDSVGAIEGHEEFNDSSSNTKGQPKEGTSGHLVVELIKNHESIIRKKTREINWLKGELSKEKGCSAIRNDRTFDSVKVTIFRVILKLKDINKENGKLIAACNDHRPAYGRDKNVLHNYLSGSEEVERETEVAQSSGASPEQPGDNRLENELYEEVRQLKEERNDLDIKGTILEEIYKNLLKGSIVSLHLEYCDYVVETLLREEIYRIIFIEIIKEWDDHREACQIERLLKEEIDGILFQEAVKDNSCTKNLMMRRIQGEERMPCDDNLFQSLDISKQMEQQREADLQIKALEVEDGSNYNINSEFIEPHDHVVIVDCGIGESNDCYSQYSQSTVENGFLEKSLQEITNCMVQLRDLESSSGSSLDDMDVANNQSHVACEMTKDGNHSPLLPRLSGGSHLTELQFVLMPLTKLFQATMDFELMTYDRIRINTARLEDLDLRLNPLVAQVNLMKKKELLYHKAFTRRCYDLQTAEAEVDLLGDQVDLLLGVLEKTYVELNHYSPVLQHYFGIMEILRLIRKELDAEATFTSRQ